MPDPNWYPDPTDDTRWRWWNGTQWTTDKAPRSDPSTWPALIDPPPHPPGQPHATGEVLPSSMPPPAPSPHHGALASASTTDSGAARLDLIAFVGWAVVLAGIAVLIASIVKLNSESIQDPDLGDYILAMSSGFIVVGVGATAAGVGHIAAKIGSRTSGLATVAGTGNQINPELTIGSNEQIGSDVVIDRNVTAGHNLVVRDNTVINQGVTLGDSVTIGAGVTIRREAEIGSNVAIGDATAVHERVVIGDDVTIGANVIIEHDARIMAGSTLLDGTLVPQGTVWPTS